MGYFLEMDGMPIDEKPTRRPEESFIEWQQRLANPIAIREKPIHDNCYRHNVGGMNPCPWGDNA